MIRSFLCLALVGLALAVALAQPPVDDCWLSVTALTADGTAFTGPRVAMYRLVDGKRVYTGQMMLTQENVSYVSGLVPGSYEATVTFAAYGLTDGPKPLAIFVGPNQMTWTAPPVIPAGGSLLRDGQPVPAPKQCQAYLATVGKSGPLTTYCSTSNGGYQLYGVFPGKYRLLLTTDSGYGYTEFAAEQAGSAVNAPITLQSGGNISLKVTRVSANDKEIPLPNATVTISGEAAKGFRPTLTAYTDANGKVYTLVLPPGDWRWSMYYPGYQTATGTVTVTANAVAPVAVLAMPVP